MNDHDPQANSGDGGAAGAVAETEARAKLDEIIEEAKASRFDWCDDDDIVLQAQPATAVYLNNAGAVVIRQEGAVYDDDPFVMIRPEYAEAVCRAVLQTAGVHKPLALPAPRRPRRQDGHDAAGQQKETATPDLWSEP